MFSLFSSLFNFIILNRSLFDDWNSVPLVISIPLSNDGLLKYLSIAFRIQGGTILNVMHPFLFLLLRKSSGGFVQALCCSFRGGS